MTITTGLVDTSSTPGLMNLVSAGKLDPLVFGTHRFALEQAEDVVSRADRRTTRPGTARRRIVVDDW